jgi:hypothetical protein
VVTLLDLVQMGLTARSVVTLRLQATPVMVEQVALAVWLALEASVASEDSVVLAELGVTARPR